MDNKAIVQRLWGLCNILRDDGITFHQYVNELSYLLFLKMAEETGAEHELPEGFRWRNLVELTGEEQFSFYRTQLVVLGTRASSKIQTIFANPTSLLRNAASLNVLVGKIDEIDWHNATKEGLGDLYEGLLEKNASDKKSGAGQYFTPRPLIESIVSVIQPKMEDVIYDPAAGTGGFLVVADQFVKSRNASKRGPKCYGIEIVQDTHRLLLMNAILHDIDGAMVHGDALSDDADVDLPAPDLVLTNPPFGNKKGVSLTSKRELPVNTTSKQLAFLQKILLELKSNGRAAVVVPDSVLFEGHAALQIRTMLLNTCRLHTILKLPDGIFYASVKTNVLFFEKDDRGTQDCWIFDLRANMPSFGKRTPLLRQHFSEFERAYGRAPDGSSPRTDEGALGRFRKFGRAQIEERNFDLNISWLSSDNIDDDNSLVDPEELTSEIRQLLNSILDDVEVLLEQLTAEEPEAEAL